MDNESAVDIRKEITELHRAIDELREAVMGWRQNQLSLHGMRERREDARFVLGAILQWGRGTLYLADVLPNAEALFAALRRLEEER